MAKFQFLLVLAFVAVMAISAQADDNLLPDDSVPEKSENFGWSCGIGGNNACAISCGLHGHNKGDAASENLLKLIENIELKEKDMTEEGVSTQRRVTCDLLSFRGIIDSSVCMANCLSMGKVGEYCERGICVCHKIKIILLTIIFFPFQRLLRGSVEKTWLKFD
ncbi:hypothetical protein HZH66_007162 [Vespula vulgaris]|uniref:Invertebrate defensins family profile domain-containing protein n=1 Tax=Vespula vulgaris TaxID=7454 RepID=A0A834N4C0_VESVU|nr:hypothetical protein HZH66_007162 [Vespula vulgaris]